MINYKELNWDSVKRWDAGSVIIVDVNLPETTMQVNVSDEERRELLVVDKYISYSTNENGSEGWVHIYHIKSRAFDHKGNLILFTKREIIK